VGNVKIRYYVTRCAWQNSYTWGYWIPSKKMVRAGFSIVSCGPDGPAAWAIAEAWNARWDEVKRRLRRGEGAGDAAGIEKVYPLGSLGEAFARFRATHTWAEKKPRTREDWQRGFKHIEPVFGDLALRTVSLEDVDGWYAALLATIGVREAHRAMKIWRALWRVAGRMQYCDPEGDPSLGIRRKTPKARSAIWYEGEAVRLVKRAWRMGYRGLAAALAVAWDTMLSPVDVRGLTPAQLSGDAEGSLFSVDRAKTGKAAIGTLSPRAARLVGTYTAGLGFELHDDAPIFRNRSGAAYSKDTLGDDFRAVRAAEFPGDKRQMMDFRRSGAVEATAGEVDPAALAGKMANTIDRNRDLQATYLPHNTTLVRLADHARTKGRARLRGASVGKK
jgi:hypothetical protein